jgi:hypothetical protein
VFCADARASRANGLVGTTFSTTQRDEIADLSIPLNRNRNRNRNEASRGQSKNKLRSNYFTARPSFWIGY